MPPWPWPMEAWDRHPSDSQPHAYRQLTLFLCREVSFSFQHKYIYMPMHMCTYMHTYSHAHMYAYACIHDHTSIFIHAHIPMFMCEHIHVCIHIFLHMCTHISIYTEVCTHATAININADLYTCVVAQVLQTCAHNSTTHMVSMHPHKYMVTWKHKRVPTLMPSWVSSMGPG